jgi:hypothetical protein
MIKPPSFAKTAVPTNKGWVDPITGELLAARSLSPVDIKEWKLAQMNKPAPTPAPEPIIEADPEPEAEMLTEANPDVDHWSLTKAQLVEHALDAHGIELDTSMTKAEMIEDLESQI